MGFEELLAKIEEDIAALQLRAAQIQTLVDSGLAVEWFVEVEVSQRNRLLLKFHVFANTEIVLVESTNKWNRYLVDSIIFDVPNDNDVTFTAKMIEGLPPIGKKRPKNEEGDEGDE